MYIYIYVYICIYICIYRVNVLMIDPMLSAGKGRVKPPPVFVAEETVLSLDPGEPFQNSLHTTIAMPLSYTTNIIPIQCCLQGKGGLAPSGIVEEEETVL